ncbi:hypothetical protein MKMG_00375 [Methanogenium sp. MK-MG]|nr:hypothetical protein MKMG_00375 [Methanogenium sp. MK-MG]
MHGSMGYDQIITTRKKGERLANTGESVFGDPDSPSIKTADVDDAHGVFSEQTG